MNSGCLIAASELLSRMLRALRASGLTFVVLRNYEKLPLDWDNDVDVLVMPDALAEAESIVTEACMACCGNSAYRVMRRLDFVGIWVTCTDRELHIDLYSSISKGWIVYADSVAIMRGRRQAHELFDIPEPLHERLLVAAKELFAYKRIRQRYHERLAGHDQHKAFTAALEVFRSGLTRGGLELVGRSLVDPLVVGFPWPTVGAVLKPWRFVRWLLLRWSAVRTVRPVQSKQSDGR